MLSSCFHKILKILSVENDPSEFKSVLNLKMSQSVFCVFKNFSAFLQSIIPVASFGHFFLIAMDLQLPTIENQNRA